MPDLDRFLGALASETPDGVGVDRWSLRVGESRRLSLGIKDAQTGNAHAPFSLSESCGARYLIVWKDGRVSHGTLERIQLEQDAEAAIHSARSAAYDDPDAAQVLGPAPMPEVEMFDDTASRLASGRIDAIAQRLTWLRERIADARLATWSGSFGASSSTSRLLSSAGLDVRDRGTSVGWHVTVNGEIGDGYGSRAPDTDAEFRERFDRIVETAGRLGRPAKRPAGQILPTLLHPHVVERFVLSTLLHHLDGAAIDRGESRFEARRFGTDEPAIRDDLHLRIDPLLPLRSGTYRCTSEGVPAAPCDFIRSGRLVQPLLGLKYARRLGLPPTPLPGSNDTLFLEGPRQLSYDEALVRGAGGVLVLTVLGVHTQDRVSGDFSLAAPQALGIADGVADGKLKATLSGNLFDVLVDPDLHLVRFPGEHTPGLLFPCRLDVS